MLALKYRLTKQKDLKKVYEKGRRASGKFFNVRYLQGEGEYPRFAVIASAKTSKKAVVRNKLKRQTREIIYGSPKLLEVKYDVIVNIYSSAVDVDYQILEQDLLSIFKKTN